MDTFTTTTYAYYDYSDTHSPASPCDDVYLQDFERVFLPTLYSLVFIVGFAGNGLVVCVLVRHRHQTTLTDLCLLSLAVSDLLFLLTLPFYAHYSRVEHWSFGGFMCRFLSTCHNTGFFSSVFFMIAMTLDRYLAIVHAHRAVRYRNVRAGVVLSSCVWLLSLCVSLPSFIFTGVNDGSCDANLQNGTLRTYDTFSTNILGLLLPLLVMVVCYSRIISTLVNMRSVKKHRVVKLIISIVVAFFVSWVPFNVCNFLDYLQSTDVLSSECRLSANIRLSLSVTESFAYSHCCLNPIIYAFVGQKFMKRALVLLREWTPGIPTRLSRDLADGSSSRKGSVTSSRSSNFTATVIM